MGWPLLSASIGQRPWMLLNTYSTRQAHSPQTQNYPAPNVNSAEFEKLSCETCCCACQMLRLCLGDCFAGQKGQELERHLQSLQHHGPGGDLLRALPASSQHPPHGQCQMAPRAEPDMEQTIHSPQDQPEEVSILKWAKGGGA